MARFVVGLVVGHLDLREIMGRCGSERGQPPFDPAMMTALSPYAYCNGVSSSRRIAKASRERVDFMSLVGLDAPDYRTVSDFREPHLKALAGPFTQVLKLCERAGRSLAMSRWPAPAQERVKKSRLILFVIPGRPAGPSPEPMIHRGLPHISPTVFIGSRLTGCARAPE
ncbi:MAG: transposase [Stellaceae bacterium]